MNEITQAIAALHARAKKIDAAIQVLSELEAGEQLIIVEADEGAVSRAIEKAARKPKAKPARKPKAGGARPRGDTLRAAVRAWMEGRAEPFTVEDMPLALRRDPKKAAVVLGNLKAAGELERVSRGVFQLPGGKAKPLAAAKVESAAAPPGEDTTNAAPRLTGFTRKELVAQAVLYFLGLNKGKSLGAAAIVEQCKIHYPQLVDTPNLISDLRVALVDAAGADLLTRIGKGPDAVYTYPPG